ncbi:MAG TPA: bifunctional 3'-5' exonuclease/DNA polymerase [Glaciihabitans sp.]|nr:bifunctional 3'-5' exonuclease/DNA polymerase [Glaciihabitans sp.]
MHVVLRPDTHGVSVIPLTPNGVPGERMQTLALSELPAIVAVLERESPTWVWDSTARWYPALLESGVRVHRCVDLRLNHVILRNSAHTISSRLATAPASAWDSAAPVVDTSDLVSGTLFDFEDLGESTLDPDPIAEFALQQEAVAGSAASGSLRLLLAAESAGSLIAAEMRFAGLPWSVQRHSDLLTQMLGPRPRPGERPQKLEQLLSQVRSALGVHDLNPDSPNDLLRALRRAGLTIDSTRSWDLKRLNHPVIAPLLEYKKLARLLAANGWVWVDTWVADGRFRPDYVPGGVVTGRWATSGGGALQLPKQIRGAVVPDPGWKLIVADAAQLEPRILTGLSADKRMAEAGRGDLYEGIVASGAVSTRAEAKVAMLGAMYGATSGDGGRLMPRLTRAFPQAIAVVEAAARVGERGDIVSTRLGRSSPFPGEEWRELQERAYGPEAPEPLKRAAQMQARSWGRFTRNFVVQGTAAEWALCWMAGLRNRLWDLADGSLTDKPHLVFFLHDEVMVHAPAHLADQVAEQIRAAAADAGRLIFGQMPITFPVTVAIVDSYADAK